MERREGTEGRPILFHFGRERRDGLFRSESGLAYNAFFATCSILSGFFFEWKKDGALAGTVFRREWNEENQFI